MAAAGATETTELLAAWRVPALNYKSVGRRLVRVFDWDEVGACRIGMWDSRGAGANEHVPVTAGVQGPYRATRDPSAIRVGIARSRDYRQATARA